MKTHNIKLLYRFCSDVSTGIKPFEVRKNDRAYQKGDRIKFIPVDEQGKTYNHEIEEKTYEITYVLSGWGIEQGYVVLGIKELSYE